MKASILKSIKCLALCNLFFLYVIPAIAQHYIPVDNQSNVQFTIVNHLVVSSTVTGHFKGLKGSINFNPKAPQNSSFDATVNVKTISTGIGKRDRDLQEEKYFDARKYPVIHIKSTKVTGSNGKYVLTAQLTIKDVTKTISFPFKATEKNSGYLFQGQFTINRMDYHVGPDNAIDKQLTVSLSVFAKKQ